MSFKKLELLDKQNIFFTSDTHYMHKNMCRGVTSWIDADAVTRDFKDLDQMNDYIVNSINDKVGEDDILFHLGDWSFSGFDYIEEFRNRIVCKNVHLIYGNHDHHIERNKKNIKNLFSSTNQYLRLDVYNKEEVTKFVLFHYPIASWHDMSKDVIHLHGHVHLPPHLKIAEGKAMDVGCDGNDMTPYSLSEIMKIMNGQNINKLQLPKDHHVKNVK